MYNNISTAQLLLNGLFCTLKISAISLVIGAGLSFLLTKGLKSNNKIVKGIIIGFMQIFKGIPVLIQFVVVYYTLPMFFPALALNQITTSIIVLTINAAVNIAQSKKDYYELLGNNVPWDLSRNISINLILRELSETVKNSIFMSVIGVADLYYATNKIGINNMFPPIYALAAPAYLTLYLIVYFITLILKKRYPINLKGIKNENSL